MLELQKLLLGDLVGAQHLFGGPFRTQAVKHLAGPAGFVGASW